MATITIPQRVEIVQHYFENGHSFAAVGRIMRSKYGIKVAPSDRSIKRIIDQFMETASAAPVDMKGRERVQPVRNEENKKRVRKFFKKNPNSSNRKAAKELNISDRSLRRILQDLKAASKPLEDETVLGKIIEKEENRETEEEIVIED